MQIPWDNILSKLSGLKMKDKELPNWLLIIVSWGFSAYFLFTFHNGIDLANPSDIPQIYYLFLVLGVLLAFLPFLKRVKIWKLLELERDIRETKNEIKEFKTEFQQMLSIISTNINTMVNQTNTITVNVPGTGELLEAKEKLAQSSNEETKQASEEIKEELLLEDEDTIMALARTRIRLEYLLRTVLNKRLETEKSTENIKFMSLSRLYRIFSKKYPEYKNLEKSFNYVRQICNAAIHAQKVPEEQALEALNIGANLIAILDNVANSQ